MQNKAQKAFACLSLLEAQSMRFRWNEENTNRNNFFASLFSTKKEFVPLELIHSKKVIAANTANDTQGLQADGIITCNENLVPILTVADCMPIYLYDKHTGCFGVLHSGWKGTGIINEALLLAKKEYSAHAEDFHIVIGPHIKSCCYTIDTERAHYFMENFSKECVENIAGSESYRLSLEKANLFLLENAGVKKEHITIMEECTCCSKSTTETPIFGSFRRETAHLPPNSPIQEMQKYFTPMAAFTYIGEQIPNSNKKLLVQEF